MDGHDWGTVVRGCCVVGGVGDTANGLVDARGLKIQTQLTENEKHQRYIDFVRVTSIRDPVHIHHLPVTSCACKEHLKKKHLAKTQTRFVMLVLHSLF